MPNIQPKEDTWAFQTIGSPFPHDPVRALGQQNLYVALWYKHGKPVHGYAWNDGGVVQASFPYNKVELTGTVNLGGMIQVLQYSGDHNSLGFWYEWIKYEEYITRLGDRQVVKCGSSMPILWRDRSEGALLGDLDYKTQKAYFSHNGIAENLTGNQLADMWIIVRNTKGGPPFCICAFCPKVPPQPMLRHMFNEWIDIRAGDAFTYRPLVKAGGKYLNTIAGEKPDQYVALWYQHGEPVMGRVWNNGGKVAATFGWFNKEFKGDVGSIQLLVELPENMRGFDYSWQPFAQAAVFDKLAKEWDAVHVNTIKGDISPCLLTVEGGKQILGKVDIRNERASTVYNGREVIFTGPAVHNFLVLCRKAQPGQKFE